MLVGTEIYCKRCGAQTRSKMVSVDYVNELRAALTQTCDMLIDMHWEPEQLEKFRKLC